MRKRVHLASVSFNLQPTKADGFGTFPAFKMDINWTVCWQSCFYFLKTESPSLPRYNQVYQGKDALKSKWQRVTSGAVNPEATQQATRSTTKKATRSASSPNQTQQVETLNSLIVRFPPFEWRRSAQQRPSHSPVHTPMEAVAGRRAEAAGWKPFDTWNRT